MLAKFGGGEDFPSLQIFWQQGCMNEECSAICTCTFIVMCAWECQTTMTTLMHTNVELAW